MPLVRAKQRFHAQRERLEAKFVQLAAADVGPNAPRLADCSFDDAAYVRSRATGELSAFVAVTIATVEPASVAGDSNAPADNLQAGTAGFFRFDRDHWETDGRANSNLSPIEAVHHFSDDFEIISEDFAIGRNCRQAIGQKHGPVAFRQPEAGTSEGALRKGQSHFRRTKIGTVPHSPILIREVSRANSIIPDFSRNTS